MKNNTQAPLFFIFFTLLFSACHSSSTETVTETKIAAESKKVNDFFQKSFEESVRLYPEFQTRMGSKENYGLLNDNSPEAENRTLQITKNELAWINDSVNTRALTKEVLLSYKLFKQSLENNIADHKYRLYNYPVNQMFGAQSGKPAFMINMHRIDSIPDAIDYINRLNGFNQYFTQLVKNLTEREDSGIVAPSFVFDKVIQDSENILTGQPFDSTNTASTLLKDFSDKVSNLQISDSIKIKLNKQAETALLQSVKPAYQELISFLRGQKLRSIGNFGVWKFPNGEAFYLNALKRTTTTNLTADEIHEIGLSEVTRITQEMNTIRKEVQFGGTMKEFFEFMKTDPQFYYTNDTRGKEAYLAKAVDIIDTMKTKLDELFITKPKMDIVVKAVEAFREKSAGKAFYNRPAGDGSRPGIYYANLYDMKSMPKYKMEALAYHEGIPGHHMQLAIQQELQDIPMFRKFGGYTAYVEGWGLYSEYIPKEMGFYADPYSNFGRLAMELWRACRLVVDTGIHSKKWTRGQSIKYYTDHTPNPIQDATKMVERHMVMPSQATSYKIGMLKILELRAKAKEALGDKFDIRAFHEVVISHGAIPLDVLEDFVNEYISSNS